MANENIFPVAQPTPAADQPATENNPQKVIDYLKSDIQDLTGTHQIALLYLIIENMGSENFFTPEEVKTKMSDKQTINCATINDFLFQCTLDGFFICKGGKFKCKVVIV